VSISGPVGDDLTGFPIGEPIELELSYVGDGQLLTFFVLAPTTAGEEPERLNDGESATLSWTPDAAGVYTIYGEFEDSTTHELVEVGTPEQCIVTLGVGDESVAEPLPPGNTCDDLDFSGDEVTKVENDDGSLSFFDPNGNWCATVLGETVQAAAAPPAELPRTGEHSLLLAVLGASTIVAGAGCRRWANAIADRSASPR
jgi:hypothetical protein